MNGPCDVGTDEIYVDMEGHDDWATCEYLVFPDPQRDVYQLRTRVVGSTGLESCNGLRRADLAAPRRVLWPPRTGDFYVGKIFPSQDGNMRHVQIVRPDWAPPWSARWKSFPS